MLIQHFVAKINTKINQNVIQQFASEEYIDNILHQRLEEEFIDNSLTKYSYWKLEENK